MRNWKTLSVPDGTHIGIVVATYKQPLLVTLGSLQAQTHRDFTCMVVHDGPATPVFERAEQIFRDDPRFEFACTPERKKLYGHNLRRYGFESLLARRSVPTLLCTTNGDNYAAPVLLEALAHHALNAPTGWAICDMVHSHYHWTPLTTRVQRKFADAACWMARSERVAAAGGWSSDDFAADWFFIEKLARTAGPPAKVPHTLVVHN